MVWFYRPFWSPSRCPLQTGKTQTKASLSHRCQLLKLCLWSCLPSLGTPRGLSLTQPPQQKLPCKKQPQKPQGESCNSSLKTWKMSLLGPGEIFQLNFFNEIFHEQIQPEKSYFSNFSMTSKNGPQSSPHSSFLERFFSDGIPFHPCFVWVFLRGPCKFGLLGGLLVVERSRVRRAGPRLDAFLW